DPAGAGRAAAGLGRAGPAARQRLRLRPDPGQDRRRLLPRLPILLEPDRLLPVRLPIPAGVQHRTDPATRRAGVRADPFPLTHQDPAIPTADAAVRGTLGPDDGSAAADAADSAALDRLGQPGVRGLLPGADGLALVAAPARAERGQVARRLSTG